MSDRTRKLVVVAAGILIILIAVGAVLLPTVEHVPPREVLGAMLISAGMLELAAAGARWTHRAILAVAGGATLVAGLRLELDPTVNFFAVLNLIILWLIVRTAAFGLAAYKARGRLAGWIALAAGIDFLLAVALLAGLPIALLVVGLFGPTGPISATFAWVIALSFIGKGILLLTTAAIERRPERRTEV